MRTADGGVNLRVTARSRGVHAKRPYVTDTLCDTRLGARTEGKTCDFAASVRNRSDPHTITITFQKKLMEG